MTECSRAPKSAILIQKLETTAAAPHPFEFQLIERMSFRRFRLAPG
jgi:hypothetical protein